MGIQPSRKVRKSCIAGEYASDTFGMPRINTASWLGPEHCQQPVKSIEHGDTYVLTHACPPSSSFPPPLPSTPFLPLPPIFFSLLGFTLQLKLTLKAYFHILGVT